MQKPMREWRPDCNVCCLANDVLERAGDEAMTVMSQKFKAKWLAALRGGKFMQARGGLVGRVGRSGRKFSLCCIGVGFAVKKGVTAREVDKLLSGGFDTTINASVKIGLTPKQMKELIDQNDNEKKNFKQIADWIEENI
jgi:hypothetical protein